MVSTFTSLHLVRHLYHECSSTDAQILEEFLQSDIQAREQMNELTQANRFLPKALFSAHPETLNRILEYSKSSLNR